ncbi:MAG: hypothetical protein ACRD2G_20060 [Terriglobia bacterium]
MELNRTVQLFLSQKGKQTLKAASIGLSDPSAPFLYALETESSGVWIQARREDGDHWLLLNWDCVLALDVPVGGTPMLEAAD